MQRFILGRKGLGYARRFNEKIVNNADDFVVLRPVPTVIMRTAVESLIRRLTLSTKELLVPATLA